MANPNVGNPICILLILLNLIISINYSFAQFPIYSSFKHLNNSNGLTNDKYNTYISYDSRGFTWIGSTDGFYKFNGSSFEHYNSDKFNLKGDIITSSFFEDEKSNMWFTTEKAIHCYIRNTDKIESIQLFNQLGDTIKNEYHLFYLQVKEGNLWLIVDKQIYVVPTSSPTEYQILPFTTNAYTCVVDTTETGRIETIYGCPWKNEPGIEFFHKDPQGRWNFIYIDQWEASDGRSISPFVTNAIALKDSSTLLFTDGNGILKINENNPSEIQAFLSSQANDIVITKGLVQDDKYLWLTTRGNGLWLIDLVEEKLIQKWGHDEGNPAGISSNDLIGMCIDNFNTIWLANLKNGIDYSLRLDLPSNKITSEDYTNWSKMNFVTIDLLGNIWGATQEQGIFVFSPQKELIDHYSYSFLEKNEKLRQLTFDNNGNLWSLSSQAIYQFNESENNWREVLRTVDFQLDFLLKLNSGKILVNSNKGLLEQKLIDKRYRLTPFKEFADFSDYPFSTIFESSNGNLYLPFNNEELWIANNSENTDIIRRKLPVSAYVFTFAESTTGDTVWVGTSEGLMQINPNFKIRLILQNHWEVGKKNIYNVHYDKRGYIWFNTSSNLWYYNLNSYELIKFGLLEGIDPSLLSTGASFLSKNGQLWFPTKLGLRSITKDSLDFPVQLPNPYIKDLLVNNVPYKGPTYVGESEQVKLKHWQNSLAFNLVAITNFWPNDCQLKYKMYQFNDQWGIIDNDEWIQFPELNPGSYFLEIAAINKNGIESASKILKIIITPPYWKTWWFRSAIFLIIVSVSYLAIKIYINFRLKTQRLKFEKEKAVLEERNRIANDLHDDLGRELSEISSISRSLLQELKLDTLKDQLGIISKRANSSLDKMEEILWVLESEDVKLIDLIEKINSDLNHYLSNKNIELKILYQSSSLSFKVGREFKYHIIKIFKEAVYNVVKHAQASRITINFQIIKSNFLTISIKDNGNGVEKSLLTKNRRGLRNMEKRTKIFNGEFDFNSQIGSGSEILLKFPLQKLMLFTFTDN